MAYKRLTTDPIWYGLSTDTRPTLSAADIDSEAVEMDTGNRYKWDGNSWNKTHTSGVLLIKKRTATYPASTGNATTTTLAAVGAFSAEGMKNIGVEIEVVTTALNALDLYVKYHASGNYIDLGIGVNWATAGYPVTASDITNDASVAVGSHYIDLDVSAFHSVQLWASVAAGTGSVNLYAGGVA